MLVFPLAMNRHCTTLSNSVSRSHHCLNAFRSIPSRLALLFTGLTLFCVSPAHATRPTGGGGGGGGKTSTLPLAPSALSATAASTTEIDLRWQDNSSNESGFKIQRGTSASGPWTQIATVGAGVTSYNNTGLSAGTTYYYEVCAYNSKGSSAWAGPSSATTLSPCTFSLSPTSANPGYGAGSGSMSVTASGSTCSWTASSS